MKSLAYVGQNGSMWSPLHEDLPHTSRHLILKKKQSCNGKIKTSGLMTIGAG